ncbi:MAG: type II CAAX endopeptidase family protein [Muricomes sp.]
MNNNPESKQFWRLAGPILLYWVIRGVAEGLIALIFVIPHFGEIINYQALSGSMDQQQFVDFYIQITEKIMKIVEQYQVEILGIVALLTLFLTVPLFFMDRKREAALQLPQNKKAEAWKYSAILVFGAAACIGMSCLVIMTNLAFMSDKYQLVSNAFYSASFPAQIIVIGIIIPITEELMFRGVLFKRYREQGSFFRAALYSSLLFSFLHNNVVQFLYTFFLGVFLAYVYEKYGSFKAPVLLHITANLVSLILTNAGGIAWLAGKPIRMGVASIVSAFIGSAIFVFMQRINQKSTEQSS